MRQLENELLITQLEISQREAQLKLHSSRTGSARREPNVNMARHEEDLESTLSYPLVESPHTYHDEISSQYYRSRPPQHYSTPRDPALSPDQTTSCPPRSSVQGHYSLGQRRIYSPTQYGQGRLSPDPRNTYTSVNDTYRLSPDPEGARALPSAADVQNVTHNLYERDRPYARDMPAVTRDPCDSGAANSTPDVLNRLADILLNKQDRLPRMEPEVFGGSFLQFPIWIKSFVTIIEEHTDSSSQRLYYLSKYTKGEAREAIQGFFSLDGDDAYRSAKATLVRRYGDKYKVAEAYRRKIDTWPQIKHGDGTTLQKLSDFLHQCLTAMSSIVYLQSLDDAEENQKIVRKLPRNVADRWNRTVDKWLYGRHTDYDSMYTGDQYEGSYPPFSEFCAFIALEARVACGPGNVKREPEDPKRDQKREDKRPPRYTRQPSARSLAANAGAPAPPKTSYTVPSPSHSTRPKETQPESCIVCEKQHSLDKCPKFLEMSPDERRTLAMANGLCFGCLKRAHLYRQCRQKKHAHLFSNKPVTDQSQTEKKSIEEPPSTEAKSKPTSATSLRTDTSDTHERQQDCHHSMIVPVLLSHEDNPDLTVETYALLDNQSNACFIADATMKNLSVPGESVNLKLTTMLKEAVIDCNLVRGLTVRGIGEDTQVPLPATYSREEIPIERSLIPKPETVEKWPHLTDVAQKLQPYREDISVGLLIGFNCSSAMMPREVVSAGDSDPYAVKTLLGWGVTGPMAPLSESSIENQLCRTVANDSERRCHFALRTHAKEVSPVQVKQMFELDFQEKRSEERVSIEDRKFLEIVTEGVVKDEDGHLVIPLPFKDGNVRLPNNKGQALKRLGALTKKLKGNDSYRKDYLAFMKELINKGYAERVPAKEGNLDNGKVWYIPHHGVYHPKKPNKIRVVFDCSANYMGEVLNHHLLQGPDLINNLTGVLCRFRAERIAFVCDIEGMYHQVRIVPEHRNYMRFLWFEDDNLDYPVEFRMRVHVFGATSSPGCANYALKLSADLYEERCGPEASDFVRRNFYVDDGLKSVASKEEAIHLIETTKELCHQSGFRLHKFVCNDREVLATIPVQQRGGDLQKDIHSHDGLPLSRTLGVLWCVESDTFQFRIQLKDNPLTRRGILSTVSSIFDPLGIVSPFLLNGKKLLQELCRDSYSWDDPVPPDIETRWQKWRQDLFRLSDLKIPRCYKPKNFGTPQTVELHNFADASQGGYGECSYLRMIDEHGITSSSLVMAKARVAPSKPVTIPRLELTAAVVAVRVGAFLDKELDYKSMRQFYWTDSRVVLGYVANEARRFHIYVANRVQHIREYTSVDQWNYIETGSNPADLASRGMSPEEMLTSDLWWKGPDFLSSTRPLPLSETETRIPHDDPEIKKVSVHTTQTKPGELDGMLTRLNFFSSWHRAKKAIALCLRLKEKMIDRKVKRPKKVESLSTLREKLKTEYEHVSVQEMVHAEQVILLMVQKQAFPKESHISRLDPYMDSDGLLRVGGRVRRANLPRDLAHPVILPRQGHITRLVIEHYHVRTCHSGRETTLNEIRASGYWIVRARAVVTSHIWKCVTCRKLRGSTMKQKMADLPPDRLEPAPPFTYSGVDFFGPFYIKEGRSEKKRWGALFTCMVSRAVHIEIAHSLTTDSFLNAYRRFVGRRGPIRQLRSDQGTNFVGAKNELEIALQEMSHDKIQQELLKDECDWFRFCLNVPKASHMGGVWERMIRSARNTLSALLTTHGSQLNDELLHTLMVETEAIINSRPLTYPDLSSSDSVEPLSPSQILTLKSKVVLPPPGAFVKEDLYCRKHWRRVQFLANEFWTRWRKEFLPTLQQRQKWTKPHQNLMIGDIVLMLEENVPRCQWPRARVIDVFPGKDEHVRKVRVKTATSEFDRPVHKLVLLYSPGNPVEEPT